MNKVSVDHLAKLVLSTVYTVNCKKLIVQTFTVIFYTFLHVMSKN